MPWLFLSTSSGLTEEAFGLSLRVMQYPAITIIARHDALVFLSPFKVLVFCLSFVLKCYLACFCEPLCALYTRRGMLPWHLLECPGLSSKMPPHSQMDCPPGFLLVGFFCLCNLFFPLPDLLSNQGTQDLFWSLPLTLVDTRLFIHQFGLVS